MRAGLLYICTEREQMWAGQPDFNYSLGFFFIRTPLENEWKIQWFWIQLDTFVWENAIKTDAAFSEEDGHSE